MKNNIIIFLLITALGTSCTTPTAKTGFVQAGNLDVYYEVHGEGPAVLLLHAGLLDHRMWDKQVEMLTENHKVITVDLPAHGNSSGIDTTILVAQVLHEVLAHVNIQKVSVIGLSYGSSCATDFAIAYPDQVEKMILVSPGLTGWEKVLQPDTVSAHYFQALDSAFKSDDFERIAETFTKAWCDGPFRNKEQVSKEVREYVHATSLKNLKQHKEDTWGNFSPSTAAENIQNLRLPVLLIYGDQDIPFVATVSHFIAEKINGSAEKKIQGVAHMLNLENTDAFNTMISDFFK